MATLKLEIITPEAIAFSEDVEMVTLPAIGGQIGIYPQHVRLITQMVPGELIATRNGSESLIAVGEGLVAVSGDRVEILTDMAIRAEDLDAAKVEEARKRARRAARRRSPTNRWPRSTPRSYGRSPICAFTNALGSPERL